jgi:hypothetical protein
MFAPALAGQLDRHVRAAPDAARMTTSEQMYFLGAPLAHVLAYEEVVRTRRQRAEIVRVLTR